MCHCKVGRTQEGKDGLCGIRITSPVTVRVNKNVFDSETHTIWNTISVHIQWSWKHLLEPQEFSPRNMGPCFLPTKNQQMSGQQLNYNFLLCPCVRSELLGKHLLFTADSERKESVTWCKTTCWNQGVHGFAFKLSLLRDCVVKTE